MARDLNDLIKRPANALQNTPVSTTAPADAQVLAFNSGSGEYEPVDQSGGGGGGGGSGTSQLIKGTALGGDFSTTSATMVTTGATVTITPNSTSSKILILPSMLMSDDSSSNAAQVYYQIFRASTALDTEQRHDGQPGGGGQGLWRHGQLLTIDEPATASPVIYSIRMRTDGGLSGVLRAGSFITAIEIGGGGGGGGGSETIVARKKIDSDTSGFPKATISFSTIDQTYDRLILKIKGIKSSEVGTSDVLRLAMNGDTTPSNYHYQLFYASNGATVVSANSTELRTMSISGSDGTTPTDAFTSGEIVIENYTTSKLKMATNYFTTIRTNTDLQVGGGVLRSSITAAITSLDLTLAVGPNFTAGCDVELWGEKEITVGGGTSTVLIDDTDSPYTATAGEIILADTTAGVITVLLPIPVLGALPIEIQDGGGNWATNNVTVDRNGSTLNGVAANDTLSINDTHMRYTAKSGTDYRRTS